LFDSHAYYLAHRSEICERHKRYRESHLEVERERGRELSKLYYESHREVCRERCCEYAKRNCEHIREYSHAYYLAHRSEILGHQRVYDLARRSPERLERKRVLERERYRRLKGLNV
jgi:hypothetical protein